MEDEIVGRLVYVQENGSSKIYVFCLGHRKEGLPIRKSAFSGGFQQVCHMTGCWKLLAKGENGNLFPKGHIEGYMPVTEEMDRILGGRGGIAWTASIVRMNSEL
jgi:hypothetical protein